MDFGHGAAAAGSTPPGRFRISDIRWGRRSPKDGCVSPFGDDTAAATAAAVAAAITSMVFGENFKFSPVVGLAWADSSATSKSVAAALAFSLLGAGTGSSMSLTSITSVAVLVDCGGWVGGRLSVGWVSEMAGIDVELAGVDTSTDRLGFRLWTNTDINFETHR